jgi:hypothetical protein
MTPPFSVRTTPSFEGLAQLPQFEGVEDGKLGT